MSSLFEVCCLLSHSGAMVTGILRTMCHVITDVTASHRPSSRFAFYRFASSRFAKYLQCGTYQKLISAVCRTAAIKTAYKM